LSKRVLVTGAAGFIGSHVCELLLARGDEVVGLDSFDPYYSPLRKRDNVDDVRSGPGGMRFTLAEGDIRDRAFLERVFSKGFDCVAHLAGLAGVRASVERPNDYVEVNIAGTVNVLEAARRTKVRNLVVVSRGRRSSRATPPIARSRRTPPRGAPPRCSAIRTTTCTASIARRCASSRRTARATGPT
jgi:UDP-glucuronate 4-epimerase